MFALGALANMLPLDEFSEMRDQSGSPSVFPLPVQKTGFEEVGRIGTDV
jgi:hypothetical protein